MELSDDPIIFLYTALLVIVSPSHTWCETDSFSPCPHAMVDDESLTAEKTVISGPDKKESNI